MTSDLRPGPSTRRLLVLFASLALVVAVVLALPLAASTRMAVSNVALVGSGLATMACCGYRARALRGAARQPWALLSLAAAVALLGNAWVVTSGTDPINDPNVVGNLSVALALVIALAGLLSFVSFRRQGRDRLVMVLDGLVVGGALLIIISSIVFPDLLRSAPRGDLVAQATTLTFPVLDSLLATLAVLVVLRSPRSRQLPLTLVGLGFLTYGFSDLVYAVLTARGTFEFGSITDIGWIVGYLLLGAAALVPVSADDEPDATSAPGFSATLGTGLVLGITLLAVVVQSVFTDPGRPARLQSLFLVLVVAAAGARQVLLTADNSALRRGLEDRVREQTTDLRRMVRQHEALLDSVGEGIYGVDTDGLVTFVNPSAATTLGWPAAELVGRAAHDMFHARDSDDDEHAWSSCPVHRAIVSGLATTVEEQFRQAGGAVIPVESTAAPLVDDHDEVRGAVVVFREISQRREVDRLKNEFLSVVSHELRTPLTAILGSLDLIATGQLGSTPPEVDKLLAVASRSSRRLSRLINDLLDFERIESGTHPMRLVTVTAADLVSAAVQQVQGMATSVGVKVQVGAVQGSVTVDEDQLTQTLINLLGNAVKFSPAGSVVVAEASEAGGHVRFSVSDEGRGIPAEKLEAVFERFTQVDSSDARSLGGTGLGLAISKSIVTRHGGRIWAASELGVGTTMSFELPAASRRHHGAGNRTVVVFDDDREVVDAYCAALEGHGHRIVGVDDVDEVAGLVARLAPDVLLLDGARSSSGSAVLRHLGELAGDAGPTVVVVSGMAPESDPVAAAASAGWLVKPVDESRLADTVVAAMHGRTGTVLLVEDDDDLVTVVSAMLHEDGLSVVHAHTAAEAVELGARVDPDVVVLDVMLPDGDGSEVVADYRSRGLLIGVPLIVYTALPPTAAGELDLGEDVYLQKSRSGPDELRAQVLAMVAAASGDTPHARRDPLPTGRQNPAHAGDRGADAPTH